MKTLILTKKELDSMPMDVQNKVIEIYNERKTSISELKSRIKNLKYKSIVYRSDIEKIVLNNTNDNILNFDIWEKTDGEQWGNCFGRKYEIRLGRKYIRVDIEFYRTNSSGSDTSKYISELKLSEILDLLEEAFLSNEVDQNRLSSIAANRLQNLFSGY